MKHATKISGYVAFFFVAFLLGCYWMFPWHRLKDFVIREVEYPSAQNGRPSGMTLEIGELSPSWLTGVTLDDVVVGEVALRGKGEPWKMAIDQLDARVSLLSLLAGGLSGSFYAELGEGELDGDFSGDFVDQNGSETYALRELQIDAEEVPLAQLGILQKFITLPMKGTLNAEVELELPEDIKTSSGMVKASIADLTVGDGEAGIKIPGMSEPFIIETVRAGDLEADISLDKGKAEIKTIKAEGKDIELEMTGNADLAVPLGRSRAQLMARFAFKDSYKNRNDKTKGLFTLMKFNPQLKRAQTKDGAIQYKLSGALARLRPAPAGSSKFK